MKKILSLCATALAVAGLAGCQTAPGHEKEKAGTVIGAVVGGVPGSQVGGGVGRSMDDTDRMKTALALESGRSGVASSWRAAN